MSRLEIEPTVGESLKGNELHLETEGKYQSDCIKNNEMRQGPLYI